MCPSGEFVHIRGTNFCGYVFNGSPEKRLGMKPKSLRDTQLKVPIWQDADLKVLSMPSPTTVKHMIVGVSVQLKDPHEVASFAIILHLVLAQGLSLFVLFGQGIHETKLADLAGTMNDSGLFRVRPV